MIRTVGAIPVEVGCANKVDKANIIGAINDKTAALMYVKSHHCVQKGMVSLEDMIKIAHGHDLPLIVDASAEEDLKKYIAMEADLVCYSGAKAIEGPTSGFICGRKDLTDAAKLHYKGIGRSMKIGKESMMGLLKAVEIDLADCPDLGPVLIALGCFCSGTTIIRNAGRLRIKECDRIAAMQEELAKMGGTVKADGDTLTIEGCALHKPTAPLNGHNDHRIVMAMAVAALAAGQPAVIEGANAVNKSWPDFFEVIKGLGAHVTNQG